MFTLACNDLGAADCSYVASAETAEAAIADMKGHAMSAHPDAMKDMTEEQVAEKMMSAVKSA